MPRFNDKEREAIKNKLLTEGERLFSLYRIKKVSVDELVQAAGISKGSFYSFYPDKEHLFMEIMTSTQNILWRELDRFLQSNSNLPPRALMKQAFLKMLELSMQYPILQKMDTETTEYLFRRLPSDVIEEHTRDDAEGIKHLRQYGIRFKCDIRTAVKTMQAVAMAYVNLSQEDEASRRKIIGYIIEGVVNEIVKDEEDGIK